eukprot:6212272-Prymnesium_polylepis.1
MRRASVCSRRDVGAGVREHQERHREQVVLRKVAAQVGDVVRGEEGAQQQHNVGHEVSVARIVSLRDAIGLAADEQLAKGSADADEDREDQHEPPN